MFHQLRQYIINLPYIFIIHCYLYICKSKYRDIRNLLLQNGPDTITLYKSIQLYALIEQLKADKINFIEHGGILGNNLIVFHKDKKRLGAVSICSCCDTIGIFKQAIDE